MRVFIVYCHPSDDSFTRNMRDAFIEGVTDSGNEYIMSDLYKMGFDPTMTEQEYLRDANYQDTPEVAPDVLAEQEKINSSDAIAFIYPVFWTEAPAKLVGWFDRVWSYGFAYGDKTMKLLDKAVILCSAGNPIERLEEFGLLDSMKKVMLGDRLFGRAKETKFVVFDSTSRENELREKNWDINLQKAYEEGRNLFPEVSESKDVEKAHRYCTANEGLLSESTLCGCFYCLKVFDPGEIKTWINDRDGKTAVCPYCGIDSVLPGNKVDLSEDFLRQMHNVWF